MNTPTDHHLTDAIDLVLTAVILFNTEPAPQQNAVAHADHLGQLLIESVTGDASRTHFWTPVYELLASDALQPAHVLQVEQSRRMLSQNLNDTAGGGSELLQRITDATATALTNWPQERPTAAHAATSDHMGLSYAPRYWTRQDGFQRLEQAITAHDTAGGMQ